MNQTSNKDLKIYSLRIAPGFGKKETLLMDYVSSERRRKIRAYKFEQDRKCSLYAALLVRMTVAQLKQQDPEAIRFSTTPWGKPLLADRGSYHFNISHTKNYILCGIRKNSPVGIDTEYVTPAPFSVMQTLFHPEEIAFINSLPGSRQNTAFFETWTKKESFAKFTGTGLTENLRTVNTKEPSFAFQCHTWALSHCICSVYGTEGTAPCVTAIKEEMIDDYFMLRRTAFSQKD